MHNTRNPGFILYNQYCWCCLYNLIDFILMDFVVSSVLTLRCYVCDSENDDICKTEHECNASAQYCKTYQKGTTLIQFSLKSRFLYVNTHTSHTLQWQGNGWGLTYCVHYCFFRSHPFSNLWGLLCWRPLHKMLHRWPVLKPEASLSIRFHILSLLTPIVCKMNLIHWMWWFICILLSVICHDFIWIVIKIYKFWLSFIYLPTTFLNCAQ